MGLKKKHQATSFHYLGLVSNIFIIRAITPKSKVIIHPILVITKRLFHQFSILRNQVTSPLTHNIKSIACSIATAIYFEGCQRLWLENKARIALCWCGNHACNLYFCILYFTWYGTWKLFCLFDLSPDFPSRSEGGFTLKSLLYPHSWNHCSFFTKGYVDVEGINAMFFSFLNFDQEIMPFPILISF